MLSDEAKAILAQAQEQEVEGQQPKKKLEDGQDLRFVDGDSGFILEDDEVEGFRAVNFNTYEKPRPGKADGHDGALLAQDLVNEIMAEGGEVRTTDKRGYFGRKLSTMHDANGNDIGLEMVRAGVARSTRDPESQQAELGGIMREALGFERSADDRINEVGRKVREISKEYAPWENATLDGGNYDRRSAFSRAFERGTNETKASLAGALAVLGQAVGNEEWIAEGRQAAERYGARNYFNPREVESIDKLTLDNAATYVVETLGELAPGLLVDAAATAATVATGGTVGAAYLGARGALKVAGGQAIKKALKDGAKKGLLAGPAASGFVQMSGSMDSRLSQAGEEDTLGASLLSGAAGAATNALPFIAVMGRSLKAAGLGDEAIDPVIKAMQKPSIASRLKDVGATAGVGAMSEAATEMTQTLVDEIIATTASDNVDWTLDTVQMLDSGLRAVIGGGTMGAGASTLGNAAGVMQEYSQARREAEANGGWDGETTEQVEEDAPTIDSTQGLEGLEADVLWAAKAKKYGKGGKGEQDNIVSLGQFDGLSGKDIRDLKAERYDEIKEVIESEGDLLPFNDIKSLIEDGQLSEFEFVQYMTDKHFGAKTNVYHTSQSDTRREIMTEVFRTTLQASRENKLKLEDKQRETLVELHKKGSATEDELKQVLNAINPKLVQIAYNRAAKFDLKKMYDDYTGADRKESTTETKTIKTKDGEVETKPFVAKPEKGGNERTETPKGEAPKEKKRTVRDDAPEWIKEGRAPTDEEKAQIPQIIDRMEELLVTGWNRIRDKRKGEAKDRVDAADAQLTKTWGEERSQKVRTALMRRDDGGKGASPLRKELRSAMQELEALNRAQQELNDLAELTDNDGLAPYLKAYGIEPTGNFKLDRAKVGQTVMGDALGHDVFVDNKTKGKKPEPKTVVDKLEFIKKEIGTRGEFGQLYAMRGQYAEALQLTQKAKGRQLNEARQVVDGYKKAVEKYYKDAVAEREKSIREVKDESQLAFAEKDEDGNERDLGDVQSVVDSPRSDREVAANYTRRTALAEKTYLQLKKLSGIAQGPLVEFMRWSVAPQGRELLVDQTALERGKYHKVESDGTPNNGGLGIGIKSSEKLDSQLGGKPRSGLLGLVDAVQAREKGQVRGDAPDNAHGLGLSNQVGGLDLELGETNLKLDKKTTAKLNKLLTKGDFEAVAEFLDSYGILPKEISIGHEPKMSAKDSLLIAIKGSWSRLKKYRNARLNRRRSDKGLKAKDAVTGKTVEIDLDAVTRWALKQDNVDLESVGEGDYDALIDTISQYVLDGISALADLRGDDGVPMYDFDFQSLGNDVVVFRMDGDKQASITMGTLRERVHGKGRKWGKDNESKYKGDRLFQGDLELFAPWAEGIDTDSPRDYRNLQKAVMEQLDAGNITESEAGEMLEAYGSRSEGDIRTEREGKDGISPSVDRASAVHKGKRANKSIPTGGKAQNKAAGVEAIDAEIAQKNKEREEKLRVLEESKTLGDVVGERKALRQKLEAIAVAIRDKVPELSDSKIDTMDSEALRSLANKVIALTTTKVEGKGAAAAGGLAERLLSAANKMEALERVAEFRTESFGKDYKSPIREAIRNLEAEISLLESIRTETLASREAKGKDTTRAKTVRLNRKLKTVTKRHRKKAHQGMMRFLSRTRRRLEKIHPDLGKFVRSFTMDRSIMTEQWLSWLGKDLKNPETIQAGYEDVINGRDTEAATNYKNFLKRIGKEIKAHDPEFEGLDAPININFDEVMNRKDGFIQILIDTGVENPTELYAEIVEANGYPEFAIGPEVHRPRLKKNMAKLAKAYEQLKKAKYLDTDGARHMTRLIHAAASYASWSKHSGVKSAKGFDANAKYNVWMEEVHPADKDEALKLMKGITGKAGLHMHRYHRRLNSVMLAFQAATVLWLSGVASIPEVSGVYARMRGDTTGMLGDMRKLLSGRGRAEMLQIARDMDIIVGDTMEFSVQELYNMNDLTTGRVSQKVQETVFKYNGVNWLTQTTRALATRAAERFLARRAAETSDYSKAQLKELGITAKEVQEYAREGKHKEKYRHAVHTFVNEAVTNPRSDQLPLIANDPRFALITTLKKFFYGFYDNVNSALNADRKQRKNMGLNPWTAIGVTAAVALPLGLLSELLRELIRYPFGRPNWQPERDVYDWGTAVLMNTGALGPLSMSESIYNGATFGNSAVAAALGPTATLAVDVGIGDVRPSRFVPVVNQLPYLAKPFNELVKEMTE